MLDVPSMEGLGRFVHMRAMQLHEARRIGELGKPELLVQTVRVLRCEHEAPEPLKIRVREYEFHEPFGQTLAAMRLEYEYVCEIGKSSFVSDDPGEPYLLALTEDAKAQRTFDGALDDRPWHARRPVALRQVFVDRGNVQALLVRRDVVLATGRV